MFGSKPLVVVCVAVGIALLSGCPVVPADDADTRIAFFVADSTLVRRGAEVTFQWEARNAAVYGGWPSCSLSRRFEGGEPQQAEEVPCQGELTEVPAAPLSAGYVNYQLNVLRRPYDADDPEPYLTEVIRIELQELEPDDPQTSIEFFSVDSTTIARGDPVSLSWSVRNPGVHAGAPSCSLSWRYEGGEPVGPSAVACTGSLQDVPDPPGASTAYVRYQLNALKSPAVPDDPYLTAVVTVTVLEAPAPEPVVVGVSPSSVTLSVGESQSFAASVTGATDQSVSWGASCGSFSGTGNPATYVAPASAATCTVTATSVADGGASASANVTVLAPEPVTVTVSPTSATLETGDALPLTATVSGTADTAVSWSASCGSIAPSGASSASFTAPAAPGTCVVTATSAADATKSASATVQVILAQEALSATITRIEAVRSVYPYPGGTSDPFGFGGLKTTFGRCGFDFYGGFGVSDSAGDHRWMCLDWSAQSGSWESGLATLLEVRTPAGVTLCDFTFPGTARTARVDLSGCSTAPSETLFARVGRDDGQRVVFGPSQPLLVLPLITAERPAEGAYYLLVNTFQFEWDPQVPLPASAELQLHMYDVVQDAPGSLPSRGTAWRVYYDIDPSNVTALINTVPINDGSHYRWFMRAEVVVDSISVSYSLSDKYRLCRSESSGSSANCSFAFTGPD
jgi:hypothetical protein